MDLETLSSIINIVLGALAGFVAASFTLGRYQQKVDGLERRVETLEKENKEILRQLVACVTKIDERTRSYASLLTKRGSPVSLSDEGRALLSKSGADKFVLDHKDNLVEKIRSSNPKSAYDVQEHAREVVEALQDEDQFTSFKDFAFREGLELEAIFIVMSLYLRDIALPLLGYTVNEVGKDAEAEQ